MPATFGKTILEKNSTSGNANNASMLARGFYLREYNCGKPSFTRCNICRSRVVFTFEVNPIELGGINGTEIYRAVFRKVTIVDDGTGGVFPAQHHIGGWNLAAGVMNNKGEIDAIAREVIQDITAVRLIGDSARPTAGMAKLAQNHQGIGGIASAGNPVFKGSQLLIFRGVGGNGVDDIQGRNTDRQYTHGEETVRG